MSNEHASRDTDRVTGFSRDVSDTARHSFTQFASPAGSAFFDSTVTLKTNIVAVLNQYDGVEAIMLHSSARHHHGAFQPSELDLLERVLKKLGTEGLSQDVRQTTAQRVMANYMAGVTDEDELVSISKLPLGR